MSLEAAQPFLESVKTDAGLQEKLKAVADAESAAPAIVVIGRRAGFDFTAEQCLEEQLSAATGGVSTWLLASIY